MTGRDGRPGHGAGDRMNGRTGRGRMEYRRRSEKGRVAA